MRVRKGWLKENRNWDLILSFSCKISGLRLKEVWKARLFEFKVFRKASYALPRRLVSRLSTKL